MPLRYVKIALVVFVALQGLFYGLQNIYNLDAAFQAVGSVLALEDEPFYSSFLPGITNPAIVWLALAVIVATELTIGVVGLKGARDLWAAVKAPAGDFNGAKSSALLACGLSVLLWFGIFIVIGGSLFHMWQTEIGQGSLGDAFMFSTLAALVFLIVNSEDA